MLASPNDVEVLSASVDFMDDPRYWHNRAEEARAMADEVIDPVAKSSMLDTEKHYERIAEFAEQRRREMH